ncbi:hypothetical protein HDU91_005118 [Kappamyces sp. JEL0680]|nr:hypothetical protein HDU91_005118 [Kappamyces sp. JEL0680]
MSINEAILSKPMTAEPDTVGPPPRRKKKKDKGKAKKLNDGSSDDEPLFMKHRNHSTRSLSTANLAGYRPGGPVYVEQHPHFISHQPVPAPYAVNQQLVYQQAASYGGGYYQPSMGYHGPGVMYSPPTVQPYISHQYHPDVMQPPQPQMYPSPPVSEGGRSARTRRKVKTSMQLNSNRHSIANIPAGSVPLRNEGSDHSLGSRRSLDVRKEARKSLDTRDRKSLDVRPEPGKANRYSAVLDTATLTATKPSDTESEDDLPLAVMQRDLQIRKSMAVEETSRKSMAPERPAIRGVEQVDEKPGFLAKLFGFFGGGKKKKPAADALPSLNSRARGLPTTGASLNPDESSFRSLLDPKASTRSETDTVHDQAAAGSNLQLDLGFDDIMKKYGAISTKTAASANPAEKEDSYLSEELFDAHLATLYINSQ